MPILINFLLKNKNDKGFSSPIRQDTYMLKRFIFSPFLQIKSIFNNKLFVFKHNFLNFIINSNNNIIRIIISGRQLIIMLSVPQYFGNPNQLLVKTASILKGLNNFYS